MNSGGSLKNTELPIDVQYLIWFFFFSWLSFPCLGLGFFSLSLKKMKGMGKRNKKNLTTNSWIESQRMNRIEPHRGGGGLSCRAGEEKCNKKEKELKTRLTLNHGMDSLNVTLKTSLRSKRERLVAEHMLPTCSLEWVSQVPDWAVVQSSRSRRGRAGGKPTAHLKPLRGHSRWD